MEDYFNKKLILTIKDSEKMIRCIIKTLLDFPESIDTLEPLLRKQIKTIKDTRELVNELHLEY